MRKAVADRQTANTQKYTISNDMSQPFEKSVADETVNTQIYAINNVIMTSHPYAKSVADQQTSNARIYAIINYEPAVSKSRSQTRRQMRRYTRSTITSHPSAKTVADQQAVNAQIYAINDDMSQPYAKGCHRPADCECADIRDQQYMS